MLIVFDQYSVENSVCHFLKLAKAMHMLIRKWECEDAKQDMNLPLCAVISSLHICNFRSAKQVSLQARARPTAAGQCVPGSFLVASIQFDLPEILNHSYNRKLWAIYNHYIFPLIIKFRWISCFQLLDWHSHLEMKITSKFEGIHCGKVGLM